MIELNQAEYLKREDLIYWIDKWFVQRTALDRIGRELNENELENFTKLIEFGLFDAVFDTIKVAIDEAIKDK